MAQDSASASSPSKYQYRGDLSKTALPEMLYKIYRFRVPGVIEAASGTVRNRIFLRAGQIVHASTSDLDKSLGAYLRRGGRLGQDVFDEIMQDREAAARRLGVLLVERRILSPAEVYAGIQGQTESIVWDLFSWNEGEVHFSIGEWQDEGMILIHLPMRRVIVDGIKQAPDPKPLVARLGGRDTVLQPCFGLDDVVEIGLEADDFELLSMVDGERTLYELCTGGPLSAQENAKLLYAFRVLELVRKKEEERAGEDTLTIQLRQGKAFVEGDTEES